MELVYLWVEDYKNIHRQGFNFSSRFECKYENNELTICDKKKNRCEDNKYIENFFGDNINVTAIVGKNGSGKSGILECIIEKTFIRRIYVFIKDRKLYYTSDFLKSKPKYKGIKKLTLNSFNDRKSSILHLGLDRLYYAGIYDTARDSIAIDMNFSNKETIKNYFNIFYKEDKEDIKIKQFIKPEAIRIIRSKSFLRELINRFHGNSFGEKLNKKYELDEIKNDFNYFFCFKRVFLLSLILDKCSTLDTDDTYWGYIESIESDTMFFTENINEECVKIILEANIEYKAQYEKFEKIVDYENFFTKNTESDFCYMDKLIKENIFELIISNEYYKFFDFDFADNNKERYYSKLSAGEKIIFSQFINLFMEIHKQKYSEYLILLDEPNNKFHPLWQKEYLNLLIDFFNNNFKDKSFHCVISSHSPFLLSDIPKQNIIFLDTSEDGKCKVLKHDEVMAKRQTFGANIHTLLSDSFFMGDGLMGEFAKGKINEIIEFFDNKNELYSADKERLYQIINAIGEPFLKEKLLFMYDERFPKTKEEQIAEYEAKIKRLKSDDKD